MPLKANTMSWAQSFAPLQSILSNPKKSDTNTFHNDAVDTIINQRHAMLCYENFKTKAKKIRSLMHTKVKSRLTEY